MTPLAPILLAARIAANRMRRNSFVVGLLAAIAVAIPKFIATDTFAADPAATINAVNAVTGADWTWVKDAGTIGVLIWMVTWFQSGAKDKDAKLYELFGKIIGSVDTIADATRAQAEATRAQAAALDRLAAVLEKHHPPKQQ